MSTVAEKLRQAREARNLTVHQVADVTKIRTDHIRALEEGKFDVFSAPVYIRGFVRTYSTLLKLDVPQIMAALGWRNSSSVPNSMFSSWIIPMISPIPSSIHPRS